MSAVADWHPAPTVLRLKPRTPRSGQLIAVTFIFCFFVIRDLVYYSNLRVVIPAGKKRVNYAEY